MTMIDKILSLIPFIIMILVSVGGMVATYISNKKLDENKKGK